MTWTRSVLTVAMLCVVGGGPLAAQDLPAKNPLEGNAEAIKYGMGLFERFATEGVYFQAFMIASGTLLVLRAPYQRNLTGEQIQAAPSWARWLLRMDQPRFQRWSGWFIIGVAVMIIGLKLANGDA